VKKTAALSQITIAICLLLSPRDARADMFGGDVLVLTQILAQSIETVLQIKSLIETGEDTLNLMRDINAGVKQGLDSIHIGGQQFSPGTYGTLRDVDSVKRALSEVYGPVPSGMDHDLIESQDQTVAEVIAMNRNLYDYADQVDRERERILYHAQVVNPQGAGKLQNQAIGVLIGVDTEILRTQSQMLKLLAQNLALSTRKEKLSTQNFQNNYEDLTRGFEGLKSDTKLPKLGGSQ
jgi:hypothetical protein